MTTTESAQRKAALLDDTAWCPVKNKEVRDALCLAEAVADNMEFWHEHVTGGCEPVVAGGCARDLALGLEPKDVDLFVPVYRPQLVTATLIVAKTLQDRGAVITNLPEARGEDVAGDVDWARRYYEMGQRPEFLGVITTDKRLDVIFIDASIARTPADIVDTFDMSICRAWLEMGTDWFGDGIVIAHLMPSFRQLVSRKEILVYPHIRTSAAHVVRVARKFPDYKLLISNPELRTAVTEILGQAVS